MWKLPISSGRLCKNTKKSNFGCFGTPAREAGKRGFGNWVNLFCKDSVAVKFSFAIFSLNRYNMNITPATIMQLISTKQALEDILKNIKCTNCTIEHGQLAMHLTSYMILIVMIVDVNDSYMRTMTLMTMTTMLMIWWKDWCVLYTCTGSRSLSMVGWLWPCLFIWMMRRLMMVKISLIYLRIWWPSIHS